MYLYICIHKPVVSETFHHFHVLLECLTEPHGPVCVCVCVRVRVCVRELCACLCA